MSILLQAKNALMAIAALCIAGGGNFAAAQSLVPAHANGWILLSNELSNFSHQDFSYGGGVVGASTLGGFNAFTFDDPDFDGAGAGYNAINNPNSPFDQVTGLPAEPIDFSITDGNGVTAFDVLDRGSFGGNFDPNEYMIEVLYKPGPNNTATDFNVMLEQWDGFEQDVGANFGKRQAEQLQWGTFQSGVVETSIGDYHANNPQAQDADGFISLRIPLSEAPQFTGNSFLFNNGDSSALSKTYPCQRIMMLWVRARRLISRDCDQ